MTKSHRILNFKIITLKLKWHTSILVKNKHEYLP